MHVFMGVIYVCMWYTGVPHRYLPFTNSRTVLSLYLMGVYLPKRTVQGGDRVRTRTANTTSSTISLRTCCLARTIERGAFARAIWLLHDNDIHGPRKMWGDAGDARQQSTASIHDTTLRWQAGKGASV